MNKIYTKIYLGSVSPRRRELLKMLDVDFTPVAIEVEELYPAELPAEEVPIYLSQLKAKAFSNQLKQGELLITADTVVIVDNKILGKPNDSGEAKEMLRMIQGRSHKVTTGVTLADNDGLSSFQETTEVEFRSMTDEQIDYYITHYSPFDKAGAYGIQEWIGLVGIQRISGCFYNVMGLPTSALYSRIHAHLASKHQ